MSFFTELGKPKKDKEEDKTDEPDNTRGSSSEVDKSDKKIDNSALKSVDTKKDKDSKSDSEVVSSPNAIIPNPNFEGNNPDVVKVDKVDDVTKFIDEIIYSAIQADASDIHIEPHEEKIIIRFRIDGLLRIVYELNKALESTLMFKFKILAKLPTDEHFAPLDGRIPFIYKEKKIDTRISILPITKGEKVVIRILSSEGKSYNLEDLGIVGKELEMIQRSYSKPYGMILAVGPTGSGKTTTLYSILKIISKPEINITTVEDPVEYDLEGVNHVQINNKVDLTFANGLRAILRQDPNVIMIGEIRDSETAKIAINAAMTGHIVLSTLHTNDAVTTIPRLVDMGVEKFLVASTLNIIVAQRLARRLCDNCKTKSKLTSEELTSLKQTRPDIASLLKEGTEVYSEKGCTKCRGTGFKGRIGLYEMLEVKENIRKQIAISANAEELYDLARENGLKLIVEDGVAKILEGITSITEVCRVTALKE